MGRERVEKMQFVTRAALLNRLLQQTAEFKQLLEDDSPFPASDYLDIRPWLHKIRPENAFLSLEEVFQLTLVLRTVFQAIRYMQEREGQYTALEQLFERVTGDRKSVVSGQSVSVRLVLGGRRRIKKK